MEFDYLIVAIAYGMVAVSAAIALMRTTRHRPVLISLFLMLGAFALMYALADPRVAQDRNAYFMNRHVLEPLDFSFGLLAVKEFFLRDYLFDLLLYLIPDSLSIRYFSVVLAAFPTLCLAWIFYLFWKKQLVPLQSLPLVAICVAVDRLFMDLSYNSLQSSLAGFLVFTGILGYRRMLSPLLFALAFFIHYKITLLFLSIMLLAIVMRKRIRYPVLLVLLCTAFLVFTMRLWFPNLLADLIVGITTVSGVQNLMPAELPGFPLSISMFAQVCLALIVPSVLFCYSKRFRFGREALTRVFFTGNVQGITAIFAVTVLIFVLAVFPEISLSLRLLIVPALFLPALLTPMQLRVVTGLKLLVFLALAFQHPLII